MKGRAALTVSTPTTRRRGSRSRSRGRAQALVAVAVFLASLPFSISPADAAAGDISTTAGIGSFSGDGGPATLAQLDPRATARDAAGNVYVTDAGNQRV